MTKTKGLSKDTRSKIVDLLQAGKIIITKKTYKFYLNLGLHTRPSIRSKMITRTKRKHHRISQSDLENDM